MSKLLDKLTKAGNIKTSTILSNSVFFVSKETIPTDLPILNVAFSGDIEGGLTSGVTIFAGESKCYKSFLAIYAMKAYMDKYPDAVALFYDSEFGIPTGYMESIGMDLTRIIHIPITNIEEMKFDMVKRLEDIERGDKVFIMVDSIGNLASKREVENALAENGSADMVRPKEMKSFFRIITPHITMKDLPCVIINHVYKETGLYAKTVVGGGTGVMYSANTVFIITKSQEKVGTDIVGYNFTINIEKSRFVREKAKMTFQVLYESGINKYSGLLDIALESGNVIKPSNGWYQKVDRDTGEVFEKKYRLKDTYSEEFWGDILSSSSFQNYVKKRYQLGANGSPAEVAEEDMYDEE